MIRTTRATVLIGSALACFAVPDIAKAATATLYLSNTPYLDPFFSTALTSAGHEAPGELDALLAAADAHVDKVTEELKELGRTEGDLFQRKWGMSLGNEDTERGDIYFGTVSGLQSGRRYRSTFFFSEFAPPLRIGGLTYFPENSRINGGGPDGRSSIDVQFTPLFDPGRYPLIIFRRPRQIPAGYNLAGISPLTIASVPEISTWCMMIAGMGVIGATMRRRRGTPNPPIPA